MPSDRSQPADFPAAARPLGDATSNPPSGPVPPPAFRPQASEAQHTESSRRPPGPSVDDLVPAARLAVAVHREAAGEHQEAEALWRDALSGPDWRQPQERYVEAVRWVTVTRHKALVAVGRLAAADMAACEKLCATSELAVRVKDDGGTGRITDLLCDDRSARSLTGLLVVGLWRQIDGARQLVTGDS